MLKRVIAGVACLVAATVATTTMGDDAITADPKHYIVEFENERVRVIRIKYGPGEKSVMHTHGPNVAIFLSDISARMHLPDGTSTDVDIKFGDTQWAENEEHLPENTGSEPFAVVLVELKE